MDMVIGVPPEDIDYLFPRARLVAGRWIERGDDYHVVIGAKLASKRKLGLGSKLEWNEQEFTVVGILTETQGSTDQMAVVPLDTARRVLKRPDWVASIDIVPERTDPASINALVKRLNESVPGIKVRTPQEIVDEVRAGLVVFNVIMLSGSVLAVFVGGLAVINTMIMSVSERTREIGIKKAVGASDWDIVIEYVTEAAVIGLVGGLVGLVLGAGMANVLNATASQALGGSEIFTVTPRLAVMAVVFAVVLGTVAGLYPAWNAARLDPVKALRTE
jgi:putative ABC transport system permease protein